MSRQATDNSDSIIPFAPTPKPQPESNIVADDSGRTIIALLQEAAQMAKDDCSRAMDIAHKLSFEVRSAEERAREAQAEAAHFRDRATRAEAWMLRIREEVEQTFFQKKEGEQRPAPSRRNFPPADIRPGGRP
jgi:hypothetical protein